MAELIQVTGLREFSRALRKLDKDLPKLLREVQNSAAELVADTARPKVARRSGKAARSVKAKSTRTEGRVQGGGSQAKYYAWLDFGGRVGRRHAVKRPFIKSGRYIYPSFAQRRTDVVRMLSDGLRDTSRRAGLETT